MRAFFVELRFILLRMVRAPVAWIMLFGLPLLLIPILGTAFSGFSGAESYLMGARDFMSFFAIALVFMFQLFSGGYSLDYIREDLLSPRKWRMHCLPCPVGVLVLAIVATTTLFSLAQGMALVAITRWALGVRWGPVGVVVLAVLACALLSQLVHVAILLAVRSTGAAQAIAWVFAYGSAVLAGVIFPLPDRVAFFRFTTTYGSPVSLARRAVFQSLGGGAPGDVALCIGVLLAAALPFGVAVFLLGRRRLA
jgi:ABC-2 type transport system permease protein